MRVVAALAVVAIYVPPFEDVPQTVQFCGSVGDNLVLFFRVKYATIKRRL
jgi:hypothetical protein